MLVGFQKIDLAYASFPSLLSRSQSDVLLPRITSLQRWGVEDSNDRCELVSTCALVAEQHLGRRAWSVRDQSWDERPDVLEHDVDGTVARRVMMYSALG